MLFGTCIWLVCAVTMISKGMKYTVTRKNNVNALTAAGFVPKVTHCSWESDLGTSSELQTRV